MHKLTSIAAGIALGLAAMPASSQTKVAIGYSGWTGFAPLTLAKEAGIFKKHGLDVDMKKIPQKDRHLAIASGDVQCAATTVETWVVWNANGVATKQIFQMDKSYGADGMRPRFHAVDATSVVDDDRDVGMPSVRQERGGRVERFHRDGFCKRTSGRSSEPTTCVDRL